MSEITIYKYLPRRHATPFVEKGEVLFRSLSYFREYEDEQVRSDEYEGTKQFAPPTGLKINHATGKTSSQTGAFQSATNARDIFVFCASTQLSTELACMFKSNSCVEIFDLKKFRWRVKTAIRRSGFKPGTLVDGSVEYYSVADPPEEVWALPARIAMSKVDIYSHQQEYRFAFARNNAFDFEKVTIQLVTWEGKENEKWKNTSRTATKTRLLDRLLPRSPNPIDREEGSI